MTFDPAQFLLAFPEFGNAATYTPAMLATWGAVAVSLVSCKRWGSQWQLGVNLYVAHEITLEAQSASAAAIGGVPGAQSGPINSKTIGTVTAAYDTQQIAEKNAGWWNSTMYGRQFYRLMRIFGAGVIQL